MNELGQKGEDLVKAHYQQRGYRLLARNFIPPFGKQAGEIDLIFQLNREIIFVEVKARRNSRFGDAFEAVDRNKQHRLIRTAQIYLQLHKEYQEFDYRIDVAAVDIDNQAEPVIILVNAIGDVM